MFTSPCALRLRDLHVRSFCCLALFFLAGAVLGAEPALPNYFVRSWKTDNGLPDNAVTAAVQTRDGYLWLGTYGGLARFDGTRFAIFNNANEPGLQSDRITGLYEDAKGILWIGHEHGDLTRYSEGKFEPQNVHKTGTRRKILAIDTDDRGDTWMLNEEGSLLRVRDGARRSLPNSDGVAQLARDRDGKLWLASGGKLAVLANERLELLTPTNGSNIFGSYIQGICPSHDGGVWIVSDGEVKKWNGYTMTEDRGTNPCNATAVAMLETSSGSLAMGTSSDGLYLLFTNRAVLHFNHANGFPNDWIRCLAEDREGTLWVGAGSAGVIALRPSIVETLDPPDHLQGRVALSATASRKGEIWIGSEGAGVYRLRNNEWKVFNESDGLSNLYVWSVSVDAQDRVWAATWGAGIFVQQGDRFVRPPGLENINIPMAATLQAADGSIWIGSASGLIHSRHGAVESFGEKDGLNSPDVRAIAEAPDGTIWFAMLGGGLGRLQNGTLKQFQKDDGLASDYVQCLKLDAAGVLWIGTYGSGLNRFKDGRFSKITTANGLPNDFICAIEADGNGYFWISSHNGIFRVAQKALDDCADGATPRVACLAYGKGEGMPSLECSGGAACKLADGRICFPTSKGLVVVDPSNIKVNLLPPPVVMEDIIASGRLLTRNPHGDSPLKIPPGQQRFEFHFTGLSFVAPEKMQFQYRLTGWDSDWVSAANDKRVAEYSYLPPGKYTFHVRACNSDGIWNQTGASFAFVVLPHFWQTWWFRLAAVLAGMALVVGSVLAVTRRRMRRKLEVLHRQQAIERERSRIAKDIHDHLGANLTRISLLSQSAHDELSNTAQAAAQLDRIYDTSRELTRSMDEIVWAINPQHDTLDSMASYLGNFAQEYLVPLNIRCRLEAPLHLPHWPITAEARHNIFLAFKEALHNVVKHSGATEVSVFLTTDATGFTLIVRDNGKGFDPSTVRSRPGGGNGLKNMTQRLEKIGGRCEILSSPGAGTEIKFPVAIENGRQVNVFS
ncbi:MAG TPA: two-component regulator propeller domain-containing protein [Verrucomicrobiae bacterium]|jgi:signal transduction histidine kinase/ligand-binding sensor domain-containing protein|nr:two-component regulator propeller domain-containing protein [Verrucomicrobiae bacterium]